jgi:uncharacterized protein YjiS (DUF1127 family)
MVFGSALAKGEGPSHVQQSEKIMRTISSAATPGGNDTGTSPRLVRSLRRYWKTRVIWRNHVGAIAKLKALSDCQLKDIGLTRYDTGRSVPGDGAIGAAFGPHFAATARPESTLP